MNRKHYPHEKSAYTAAAVVLAADVLSGSTGAAGIFRSAAACLLRPRPSADPAVCGCAS